MMQFGINYILKDGSRNSNNYAVTSAQPVLQEIPIAVSPNPCIGPATGTGTCTISWKPPAGLSSVNGETYRLKYWLCPSPDHLYGTDCPGGGKKIVPSLRFHSDTRDAGFAAPDGSGSWELDPSRNWNWASTTSVPDCAVGQKNPACNPDVPTGNSYTFHTLANTTYSFSLFGYQVSGIGNTSPNSAPPSPAQTVKTSGLTNAARSSANVTGLDSSTQFSVQSDDLAQAVAGCSECRFQSTADLIEGQTTAVVMRSATSPPVADRVILKQGALNGTVISVGVRQFVLQPSGIPELSGVLVVITPGVTEFVNLPENVEVGETLGVRGLLFRVGPLGGPTLIARRIAVVRTPTSP